MTVTRVASYLLVFATVLSLAACADGGMGSQQQSSTGDHPKAVIPVPSGGY